MTEPAPGSTAERVRQALATAEIGRGDLFGDLAELDGIGAVDVAAGVAHVEITLPVPDAGIRARIEGEIADAATAVPGVETVVCGWRADPADAGERVAFIPDVKNVIAISSGKGGVGKSTVAANLAVALADAGAAVGLLDADIYGPNAPALLGLSDASPRTTHRDDLVPREAHGVKVMSMGFLVGEDDPIIWRGPIVDDVLKQLFGDVRWGDLDYLVVDLPPGTGDTQLSLVQHLPVTGAVIVTTPQSVAVDDARRGLRMFAKYGVPILGVVENMSGFTCTDCGHEHAIFGGEGGTRLAEEFEIPVLGRLPLDPAVGVLSEQSEPDERGVTLPLVGRLALPRSQEHREQGGRFPPIALREDGAGYGGGTRGAARTMATAVAARVNALARQSALLDE
ncbi:P-loop NTPase [Halomarina halobia]|uniref:Iron-sulfur cluster carrier protein n=1 Tax=Halomarina halobia TaxID=3033386 RepID=A0ABD6ADE8_9EURY|nr:Mrp/NBP35 family ATP-binding protein [Halomarina sp. PSR21]